MRGLLSLGAVLLLVGCNASTDATDRARSAALGQAVCAQRGIAEGGPRYEQCRVATTGPAPLIEAGSPITTDGTLPPTGNVQMNPYSTRPQRGVYGAGI